MKLLKADNLPSAMKPGKMYRRAELGRISSTVDRDLKELVKRGVLRRPAAGLYYRPKLSCWGEVPADVNELVAAFLKTDDFLVTSLNVFNSLGVGLTQMGNAAIIYNRRRSGRFLLDGMVYEFKRPGNYPARPTEEFLHVDLLNNLKVLPKRPDNFESLLKKRLLNCSRKRLERCAQYYGKMKTQKIIRELLADAN